MTTASRPPDDTPPRPANWPLQSFDARDWAQAFCDIYEQNHGTRPDEGWMITWFANALMRGYDEARWKQEREAPEAEVSRLREALQREMHKHQQAETILGRTEQERREAVADVSRLQQEHLDLNSSWEYSKLTVAHRDEQLAERDAEIGLLKRSLGILERMISEAEGR